jgi:hypothetical protein
MRSLELVTRVTTRDDGGMDVAISRVRRLKDESNALAKTLREQGVAMKDTAEQAKRAHSSMGESAAATAAKFTLATGAIYAYGAAIKSVTVDSALYAARTQTLSVVTDHLAKVNGLHSQAVQQQAKAVQQLGITAQESYNVINRMIFAQLDLSKATDLARLSQEAAVIAGVNSSEALNGIIHGIVTRQPEVLRTYGIVVNFEQEYARAARKLGRDLTDTEKVQVAMNRVLEEGQKITGAYEAAMGTAGKQITSLTRYVQEAKDAIGREFEGEVRAVVGTLTDAAKHVKDHADVYSNLAIAIAGATTALTTFYGVAKGIGAIQSGSLAGKLGLADLTVGGMTGGLGAVTLSTGALLAYNQHLAWLDEMNRQYQMPEKVDKLPSIESAVKQRMEVGKAFFEQESGAAYRWTGTGFQKFDPTWTSAPRRYLGPEKPFQFEGAEGTLLGALKISPIKTEAQLKAEAELAAKQAAKAAKDLAAFTEQVMRWEAQTVEQLIDSPILKLEAERAEKLRQLGVEASAGKWGGSTGALASRINSVYDRRVFDALGDMVKKANAAAPIPAYLGGDRSFSLDTSGPFGLDQFYANAMAGRLPLTDEQRMFGRGVYSARDLTESMGIARDDSDTVRQRSIAAMQAEAQHRERMIELTTGPAGEVAAAQKLYDLRVDQAHRLYDLSAKTSEDEHQLRMRLLDAQWTREQEMAELRKRDLEQYQDTLGRVFDSMTASGSGGLGQMIRGYGRSLGRQFFINAGTLGYDAIRSSTRFEIPGQRNADGSPTWLGKLLDKSPFAPDPLKQSTDANTTATIANTRALVGVAQGLGVQVPGGVGGGVGGAVTSALGIGGLFGGVGTNGIATLRSPSIGATGAWMPTMDPTTGVMTTVPGGVTPVSKSSTLSKSFGIAGAGIAGGLGIYSGIKEGGLQGGLTALGSAAGMSAAILPALSSSLALAGPIGAGVAAGVMLVKAFLPNPKEQRANEIAGMVERARYERPEGKMYQAAAVGGDYDYNYRGDIRVYQPIQVNIPVNAIDRGGFIDHADDIGDAVKHAIQKGHEVMTEIRAGV